MTPALRLVQTVEQPTSTLPITEILEGYASSDAVTDGTPDIKKIQPISLNIPDKCHWTVGKQAGRAWDSGKAHNEKQRSNERFSI
jgi:hypothetical protein